MRTPFIVYALPRSRTAWLATFLTVGGWRTYHEQSVQMRSLRDVAAFFARDSVGAVDTAASPGWPLIQMVCPGIRQAVIRRPIEEVLANLAQLDIAPFVYDFDLLRRHMRHFENALDRISAQPGVLTLAFDELPTEAGCAKIFQHCLEAPMPRAWWERWKDVDVQMDVREHLHYFHSHLDEINGLKRDLKSELRALARARKGRDPATIRFAFSTVQAYQLEETA